MSVQLSLRHNRALWESSVNLSPFNRNSHSSHVSEKRYKRNFWRNMFAFCSTIVEYNIIRYVKCVYVFQDGVGCTLFYYSPWLYSKPPHKPWLSLLLWQFPFCSSYNGFTQHHSLSLIHRTESSPFIAIITLQNAIFSVCILNNHVCVNVDRLGVHTACNVCVDVCLHDFLLSATQATVLVCDYSPSRPDTVLSVKTTMPSN